MSKTKTLITGAAGFLGRALVDEMRDGATLRGFDIRQGPQDIDFIVGDLCDRDDVRRAVEGQEVVIHIGGMAHPLAGSPDEVMRVNVMGTWNVLSAASELGVRRVVVCSTDSVIGFTVRSGNMLPPDYLPIDEDHPQRPTDHYGLSKMLVEDIAKSFALRGKMEIVVMRPVFILYPEIYEEVRRRAADPDNYTPPAKAGAPGAGGGVAWHHVDPRDAARAFRLAAEKPGLTYETFFVSADCTFTPDPTLERVRQFLGSDLPPVRKPEVYEANRKERREALNGWESSGRSFQSVSAPSSVFPVSKGLLSFAAVSRSKSSRAMRRVMMRVSVRAARSILRHVSASGSPCGAVLSLAGLNRSGSVSSSMPMPVICWTQTGMKQLPE